MREREREREREETPFVCLARQPQSYGKYIVDIAKNANLSIIS